MEYRFKEIREDNDLKQKDISSRLNITRGNYANIEAEIANIKLKYLLKFCNEFNYTMDYVTKLSDSNDTSSLIPINKINKKLMSKRLLILEKSINKEAKEIAHELGITESTYSKYKNYKLDHLIQTLMLKRLCERYGYSMDWVCGRSDKKFL